MAQMSWAKAPLANVDMMRLAEIHTIYDISYWS